MAKRVDIDEVDLTRLFNAIRYVIDRYKETDTFMVKYLSHELEEVGFHVENEQRGDIVASEIDAVLSFIGGHRNGGCEGTKNAQMDVPKGASKLQGNNCGCLDRRELLEVGRVSRMRMSEARIDSEVHRKIARLFSRKNKDKL